MSDISEVIVKPGYLHFRFTGPYEHMRKIDQYAKIVRQAIEEHHCECVLFDMREVTGMEEATFIEGHEAGQSFAETLGHRVRATTLFPKTSGPPNYPLGRHMENVAVNRGMQYRVFWDLEEAVAWLTHSDAPVDAPNETQTGA